jgi:hypothetical protein
MLIYTQNNLLFPQATVKRIRKERRKYYTDSFYIACHQTGSEAQ